MSYGLDATHDLLEISADLVRFAPIPGLEEAARVLLTIWESLQLVEVRVLFMLSLVPSFNVLCTASLSRWFMLSFLLV